MLKEGLEALKVDFVVTVGCVEDDLQQNVVRQKVQVRNRVLGICTFMAIWKSCFSAVKKLRFG